MEPVPQESGTVSRYKEVEPAWSFSPTLRIKLPNISQISGLLIGCSDLNLFVYLLNNLEIPFLFGFIQLNNSDVYTIYSALSSSKSKSID